MRRNARRLQEDSQRERQQGVNGASRAGSSSRAANGSTPTRRTNAQRGGYADARRPSVRNREDAHADTSSRSRNRTSARSARTQDSPSAALNTAGRAPRLSASAENRFNQTGQAPRDAASPQKRPTSRRKRVTDDSHTVQPQSRRAPGSGEEAARRSVQASQQRASHVHAESPARKQHAPSKRGRSAAHSRISDLHIPEIAVPVSNAAVAGGSEQRRTKQQAPALQGDAAQSARHVHAAASQGAERYSRYAYASASAAGRVGTASGMHSSRSNAQGHSAEATAQTQAATQAQAFSAVASPRAKGSQKKPAFFSSEAPAWFGVHKASDGGSNPPSQATRNGAWNRFRGGIVVLVVLLVVYLVGVAHFSTYFYPSSTIGPVDVSGMTQAEAAEALEQGSSNYQLSVTGDNVSFTLAGDDAGLALDTQVIAANAKTENNPWIWPVALLFPHDYASALSASVDSDKLSSAVTEQVNAYNQTATAPVNAKLSYDKSSGKFQITAEKEGTTLDADAVASDVTTAIESLSDSLTLTDADYEHPTVTRSNENLQQAQQDAETVLKTDLKFQIAGTTVTELKGSDVAGWVTTDDEGNLALSSKKYQAWCSKVASKYTTKGSKRTFTNPSGNKVTVSGGDYGWVVDEDSLVTTVHDDVLKGESTTLDIPMSQTADTYNSDGTDFDAYIEVDIGEQHATYYNKNGKVIWESDVVTGAPGDTATSVGVYSINNKESPSTLNGYNLTTGKKTYSTKVQYWMPWDGNVIGFHDASWQSAFGGTRYKDGYGSNGCVNLPPKKAKSLYKLVSIGTVVVSHK